MRGCMSGPPCGPSGATGCAPGTGRQPPVGGALSSGDGPAAAPGRALSGRLVGGVAPFNKRPVRSTLGKERLTEFEQAWARQARLNARGAGGKESRAACCRCGPLNCSVWLYLVHLAGQQRAGRQGIGRACGATCVGVCCELAKRKLLFCVRCESSRAARSSVLASDQNRVRARTFLPALRQRARPAVLLRHAPKRFCIG